MDNSNMCALSGVFIALCAALGRSRSEMAAQILRDAAINTRIDPNEARIYGAITEDFASHFLRT